MCCHLGRGDRQAGLSATLGKEGDIPIRAYKVSGHPWFPANVHSFELPSREGKGNQLWVDPRLHPS